jgi:hypothetical protein
MRDSSMQRTVSLSCSLVGGCLGTSGVLRQCCFLAMLLRPPPGLEAANMIVLLAEKIFWRV